MMVETYAGALLGGLMIGVGSLLALVGSGKVPGISGVLSKALRGERGDTAWRLVFLAGLLAGAGALAQTSLGWQGYAVPDGRTGWVFAIGGALVGLGTRLGGGCTSGHGVCGIGAGAKDGLAYTLVFMATGVGTVWLWNLAASGGIEQ